MIFKSILTKLKGKKIDAYVKDLGQYALFQGILNDINEEMLLLKSRYNKLIYIPLSEIVVITEHEAKSKFLEKIVRADSKK
jgi:hypothetical protein